MTTQIEQVLEQLGLKPFAVYEAEQLRLNASQKRASDIGSVDRAKTELFRGTGKTTRLIVTAVVAAANGEDVTIIDQSPPFMVKKIVNHVVQRIESDPDRQQAILKRLWLQYVGEDRSISLADMTEHLSSHMALTKEQAVAQMEAKRPGRAGHAG